MTIATERGIEAKQVNMDVEPLPFADGAFDTVTCLDALEHVFDPRISARRSRAYAALARHSSLRRPTCVTGATGAALSADGSQKPRTTKKHTMAATYTITRRRTCRDLIAPWFEVTQVKGVPGGSHAGKSARLIRFLLPQRQAEEFACPGIALLARRKPTSAT